MGEVYATVAIYLFRRGWVIYFFCGGGRRVLE